jgi:hypothetical protein
MNDNQKLTEAEMVEQTSALNEKFAALLEGKNTEAGVNSLIWVLANVVYTSVKPEDLGPASGHVVIDFLKALAILTDNDDDEESPSDMIH